jgi:trigger factor
LIGLEAGDEKTFEYTFPEDYTNESMRGEQATFAIKCLEVKSRFVPEWTDELAKSIGDYESLLDLRIGVRKDLKDEATHQAETNHGRAVVDKVVEGATVSFPPILLQQEISDMVNELEDRLRMQRLSLEDYLKIEGKTEEELINEFEPVAAERLRRGLILSELVSVENIDIDETEIDREIDRFLERFEDKSDKTRNLFNTPDTRRRIALDLLSDKAIKRLIAIAAGEAEQQNETELEADVPSEIVEEKLEVDPKIESETSEEISDPSEGTTDMVSEMEEETSQSAPEHSEE